MDKETIMDKLDKKFMSGNNIPVRQAVLTLSEYASLKIEFERLKEVEWMYNDLCK